MAKVDVKKLKKMLTLSHYDAILRELGIPIFSKSNTEWRCFIKILMMVVQVLSFTLIQRYSKGIQLEELMTQLPLSKPA